MNLDIKLKKGKVNEIIDCLEYSSTSFEELDMILLDNESYICDLNIKISKIRTITVVLKISLTNKKSKAKESKIIYINKAKQLFEVLNLTLLNVDISLKLDFTKRDTLNSIYIYKYYEELISDDFGNLFKLIKYNQLNDELYLAETLALLLSESIELMNNFSKEQYKYLTDKLSYYGYDDETLYVLKRKKDKSKLDELMYDFLFEIYYGSNKTKDELNKEANKLYMEYLYEYFLI